MDAFMQMYPGITPDAVLGMDLDFFEALPVVRGARAEAEEMRRIAAKAAGG